MKKETIVKWVSWGLVAVAGLAASWAQDQETKAITEKTAREAVQKSDEE